MFFKHHLTVSALADPLRLTDSLSTRGRGRMDGSTGVDRGHKAKTEGNARRGSSERIQPERRNARGTKVAVLW